MLLLLVQVLLLGSCQALLESCMYIFVFLWTPVLDTGATPLGMVFSCFMVNLNITITVMDHWTITLSGPGLHHARLGSLLHPELPRLVRGCHPPHCPHHHVSRPDEAILGQP